MATHTYRLDITVEITGEGPALTEDDLSQWADDVINAVGDEGYVSFVGKPQEV